MNSALELASRDSGIGSATAAFERGLVLRREGRCNDAITWYRCALIMDPALTHCRYELAAALREQRQTDKAESVYRAILADEPRSWVGLAGLAQCARLRGDLQSAIAHFADALTAAPRPPDAWLPLEYAGTLRELGRAPDAEAIYRALLAHDPHSWHGLAGLGQCARLQGDLSAATAYFGQARAAAPGNPERWLSLEHASLLRERRLPDEAEAIYRQVLAEDADAWHAMAGLAQCARLRGDSSAALEHFTRALAAAPTPPERWLRLECAGLHREQGRAAEAEVIYRALLADEPDSWQAQAGLGQCARLRNDRVGALAHFQAATAAAPAVDEAWFELAGEHREAGRFEAARAILRDRLALHPDNGQAWLDLGHVERDALERAAALRAFREGHARNPLCHRFLIDIAIEEWALGHYAAAESGFMQAARVDELAAESLAHLGEMLRDGQEPERAVSVLERALSLPSAPAWTYASMAQSLADLGRMDEALTVLDAAERRVGRLPEIALKRVGLLRRAGLRDDALAAVRDEVERVPLRSALWFEWFENERFSADAEALDHCMSSAPVGTDRERADLRYAHGLLAEQGWRFAAAAAEFSAALALDPANAGFHEALARVSLLLFDMDTAEAHLKLMKQWRMPRQVQQGLSRHLSHTHIGNLADEFQMDPAALAQVREALAGSADCRVARLLSLVRGNPGHTPTAIGLMIALREANAFVPVTEREGAARIPATIAQYWDGNDVPADIDALMATWRLCNPRHGYTRFDDDSAQAFLAGHFTPDVLHAYRRARQPAMKADVFRLAHLFALGGCYADADDRCLRPVDPLIPPQATLVAYQEDWGTLGNNFLAAAPGHPLLGLALRLAVQSVNRGDDDLLWLATGPGLITRAFAQSLADSTLLPGEWLKRTVIHDRAALERTMAVHCSAAYKQSRRHWSRASFGQPKSAGGSGLADAGNTAGSFVIELSLA